MTLPAESVILPSGVFAAIAGELDPPPSSASPLGELLRRDWTDATDWDAELDAHGLIDGQDMIGWLRRSLAVVAWPEAAVRIEERTLGQRSLSLLLAAVDTLVFWGGTSDQCWISRPIARADRVELLVERITDLDDRSGEPEVLEVAPAILRCLERVMASDRTQGGAVASLIPLTSGIDDAGTALEALVDDEVLTLIDGIVGLGPAASGWEDVLACDDRMEVHVLDAGEGAMSPQTRSMFFLGSAGSRAVVVPDGPRVLLARPTADEARIFLDAMLTPEIGLEEEQVLPYRPLVDAWRERVGARLLGAH